MPAAATSSVPSVSRRFWRGTPGDCVVAVGIALIAVFCRAVLHPWLGDREPFLWVYPAVLAVTVDRGWRAAALTLLVAGAGCHYLFVPPEFSLRAASVADTIQSIAAVSVCALIIALTESGRRARSTANRHSLDLGVALKNLRAEGQALEASRELSRLVVQSATEYAIFTMDQRGAILTWNPGAAAILGFEEAEMVGRSGAEIFTPEDRAAGVPEEEMARAAASGRSDDERWHLKKDGTRFWASGALMTLHDPAGKPAGYVKILRDRTEHQLAQQELEGHAQDLARSNSELEEFAYVASHDLKEPLRGISTYASFLSEDVGPTLPADAREKLESIGRLAKRMYGLLDSLLEYSRVGRSELRLESVNLGEVVAEAADSLKPWMGELGATLTVRGDLPTVRADRVRLTQVLSNLIANAAKYNDQPRRTIEVGVEPGDPPVIYVRDNGIGIPARHTEHVFRMFRRLHGRDMYGGGSGAGLSIARKIVERHGGRIWHGPAPDRGTVFRFTLAPVRGARPALTLEHEIKPRAVPGRDEMVPGVEAAARERPRDSEASDGDSAARGARRQ